MTKYFVNGVATYGYVLILNQMMGSTENRTQFGPFTTREEALAFHNAESVDPYTEEGPNTFDGGTKLYRKSFRKGGPLEWYNPLTAFEIEQAPNCFGHGLHEILIDIAQVQRLHPIG